MVAGILESGRQGCYCCCKLVRGKIVVQTRTSTRMKENFRQLFSELSEQAARVRSEYDDLFDPDIPTIPIPFL
jgi:hypothetical protein